MNEGMRVWVQGRQTDRIGVRDRGLQFGDGLFETMAVLGGRVIHWPRHRERLRHGCERLGLPAPGETLEERVEAVARQADNAVLKLILTRGEGRRGYAPPSQPQVCDILQLADWPAQLSRFPAQGLTLRWCRHRLSSQPALAGLKHLNRLDQVMACAEWTDPAIDEGLMRDQSGRVVEGTRSNLFIVAGGTLVTPPLETCGVAGIMRAHVLDCAAQAGIAVATRHLTTDDVLQAEEIFMTNSLMGIGPVHRLDTTGYASGALTRQLIECARQADRHG